jgi:hypothetical protein
MNKSITPRRRANLEKLADYLESLPRNYKHFDMGDYAQHTGDHDFDGKTFEQAFHADPLNTVKDCGTVACAVGHGPAAGIPLAKAHLTKDGDGDWDIDWDSYAANFTPSHTDAWNWMFGSSWEDEDNHHFGAAARILYYLDKGVPAGFSYWTYAASDHVKLYQPYHLDNRSSVLV